MSGVKRYEPEIEESESESTGAIRFRINHRQKENGRYNLHTDYAAALERIGQLEKIEVNKSAALLDLEVIENERDAAIERIKKLEEYKKRVEIRYWHLCEAVGKPRFSYRAPEHYVKKLLDSRDAALERIRQLEAARVAYANEFPLNADGEPNVGSIHQNIRDLKHEKDTALERVRELESEIKGDNGLKASKDAAWAIVAVRTTRSQKAEAERDALKELNGELVKILRSMQDEGLTLDKFPEVGILLSKAGKPR